MKLDLKQLRTFASSRYVLYFLSGIAASLFAGYISAEHTTSAEMMVIAGLAIRTATSNMIYVLLAAVVAGVLTSMLLMKRGSDVKEGMENSEHKSSDEEKTDEKDNDVVVQANSVQDAIAKVKSNRNCKKWKDGKCIEPIDENEAKVPQVDASATIAANAKEATMAAGKGGTARMNKETEAIINQQQKLLEAMEKMEPMMTQAQTLLDKVSNLGSGTSSIANTIAALSLPTNGA